MEPVAIVVVDLLGQNGVCSNCNQPATINDTVHACGVRVSAVAINTEYAIDPPLARAKRVSDMTPAGVAFIGVGRVVGDLMEGYHFEQTKQPGDLA